MDTTSGLISTEKSAQIRVWFFIFAVWTFALEYALYIVPDNLLDKLIKIGAFVCLVVFVRDRRSEMTRSEKILIILFYLLFLSALVPSLLMGDWVGVVQWLKLVFMSMILPILILCYYMLRGKEGLLVSSYITLAVIFSIQAVIAFIAVYGGIFDGSNIVKIGRLSYMPEVSFGIFGFGNAIQTPIEGVRVLRPQGWFLEPSLLASFLLLPAFACVGRFWQCRKKIYFFSAIIIFLTIFLTISLAGYYAVIAGVLFLSLSKPFYAWLCKNLFQKYIWLRKYLFLKYIYVVPIVGIFLIIAYGILHIGHLANKVYTSAPPDKRDVVTTIFRRAPNGPSGNLLRENYKKDVYISSIVSNPLGIGFSFTAQSNEITSGNSFVYWSIAGGIPAMVLAIIFFVYFFIAFCHSLLMSENVAFQCLAASFIGHAIHNLSYGNWLAPYFLIHLALVVMYAKKLQDYPSESYLKP